MSDFESHPTCQMQPDSGDEYRLCGTPEAHKGWHHAETWEQVREVLAIDDNHEFLRDNDSDGVYEVVDGDEDMLGSYHYNKHGSMAHVYPQVILIRDDWIKPVTEEEVAEVIAFLTGKSS